MQDAVTLSSASGMFRASYRPRHSPGSSGNGIAGVRHVSLVLCYLQALERLRSRLAELDWQKPFQAPVQVEILPIAVPFFEPSSKRIALPCRHEEPNLQVLRQRAAVEAAHEGMHAFTDAARNPLSSDSSQRSAEKQWRWMHEATAVMMENFLFPDNPESLRFALEWADQPHVSLMAPAPSPWRYPDPYHAGYFLRYVVHRSDSGIISRLWNESQPDEAPFKALQRLLPDLGVLDAGAESSPLFSEYAFDSYFLGDCTLASFAPDVQIRYRERGLRSWCTLKAGETPPPFEDQVSNLACHYYRVDAREEVTVTLAHQRGTLALFAGAVTREMQRGRHSRTTAVASSTGAVQTLRLPPPDPGDDYAVVCVANPMVESTESPYTLTLSCL